MDLALEAQIGHCQNSRRCSKALGSISVILYPEKSRFSRIWGLRGSSSREFPLGVHPLSRLHRLLGGVRGARADLRGGSAAVQPHGQGDPVQHARRQEHHHPPGPPGRAGNSSRDSPREKPTLSPWGLELLFFLSGLGLTHGSRGFCVWIWCLLIYLLIYRYMYILLLFPRLFKH